MTSAIVDVLLNSIAQADGLYQRLILFAAPSGSGKTAVLQTIHAQTGARLINVNLAMSRQLLEFSARQRSLQLP